MLNLAGKKVTVIGARRSGIAVAQLVLRHHGLAKISDASDAEIIQQEVQPLKAHPSVKIELGAHTQAFIEDSDILILSPGVRYDAPPVQWALAKNIPVWGEVEFAWRFCEKPVVAITGSNGKTTVSHLITQVLQKGGLRACLCGNVGSPFCANVSQQEQYDYFVLEISSFQLESIEQFSPKVAVLINFSQNHLDRHKDLKEYFDAKKRIFSNQQKDDYAVLNAQDPWGKPLGPSLKAKVFYFNTQPQIKKSGIQNPNYLAALEVGRVLNIPESRCLEVFRDFKGVEHRRELVRVLKGVEYVNDSKSTTAEATRWALERAEKPLILICGGRDKHIDYSVLRSLVKQKVKMVLVIGEAREKIKQAFADIIPLEEAETLDKAVHRAKELARSGDCVVLSPMCASFDMFNNFEHRGKVFKEIVARL